LSTRRRWGIGRGARLGLSVFVLVLAVGLWPASAPAVAADATMTFVGALDVDGLLSGITVRPTTVTIPAGGEVDFANATSVPLTVTVGGRSAQLGPGGVGSMVFTGAAQQETFVATAVALDLPLVGSLTSSSGRVVVRPVPVVADAGSAAPWTGASGLPATPGQFGAASEAPEARGPAEGSVIPLTPSAGHLAGPSTVPSTGTAAGPRGTADSGRTASAGAADRPGGGDDGGDQAGRSAERHRAHAVAAPVLPPFPGFSNTRDQLGLVILLSAAMLAGLGAALTRTVLAYRPLVLVGAHSQAARKARRLRRGR
jgi:hypothetical protein